MYLSPCTIVAPWAYIGKVPTKDLFISGIFTVRAIFPSNPILSLPYLDLLTVGGHFYATLYCSCVFHGYWYLKVLNIHLLGYLFHTVTCTYKCKVPSKDLKVVYDQFVSSHRTILSLLNGHASMHIAVI